MNSVIRSILIAAVLSAAGGAQAYVVYNNSRDSIYAAGTGNLPHNFDALRFTGAAFEKTIGPGGSAPCPKTDKACAYQSTGIAYLFLTYGGKGGTPCSSNSNSYLISFPADGYVTVDNEWLQGNQLARVVVWNADHSPRETVYCPPAR